MDPVSTGLGVASLTFQVFSGCIKGYQLLTDAKGMPEAYQYLRVRLKTEQCRLLDWAHVAQLNEDDSDLLISNASKSLLLDVLDQKERLLSRFGRLDDKYKKLRRPLLSDVSDKGNIHGYSDDPPEYSETTPSRVMTRVETSEFQNRFPQSESLQRRALSFIENTRKYPARLKWASWDHARFESLLVKVSAFNDFMKELLNTRQLEMLAQKSIRTDFQIMQLNSKMDQLIQIFESGTHITFNNINVKAPINPVTAFLHSRGIDQGADDRPTEKAHCHLSELAQFKCLNHAIDHNDWSGDLAHGLALDQSGPDIMNAELDRSRITLLNSNDDEICAGGSERPEAYYMPPGDRRKQVWIEWKNFEPLTYGGGPNPKILERVQALAALLRRNHQTERFRAPHCLGYFRDIDSETKEDRCRFGLVFEKPAGVHPATRPISLLELLRDKGLEMPSLTDRLALAKAVAECIERLHAVNWLHKGVRSDNIIFFSETALPGSTHSSAGRRPSTEIIKNTPSLAPPSPDREAPDVPFSAPYISGFDYSRPAQNEDMTEQPPENPAFDLYRHARVHGSLGSSIISPNIPIRRTSDTSSTHLSTGSVSDSGGHSASYKKSYDIYSLGVILLEIAFWKPIDVILDIDDVAHARPSVTIRVRQRLLGERPFLAYVRAHLGFNFEAVVRACLEGPRAFGIKEGVDERGEEVGARLQREFYQRVVHVLGEMRV